MIPEIIELKILDYLSIKPMKRCRATNKKENICQKNAEKGYVICHQHRKILERISKKNGTQFAELCIMLRRVISNNKYKSKFEIPIELHTGLPIEWSIHLDYSDEDVD